MYKFYLKGVPVYWYIIKILIYKFSALQSVRFSYQSLIKPINLGFLFLTMPLLHVCATSYAQSITINKKNASLTDIFKDIRQQTDYDFIYSDKQLATAKKVDIEVTNASLKQVLDKCFENQLLTYQVDNKTITIEVKQTVVKPKIISPSSTIDVSGTVIDEAGTPLVGAGVAVKGIGNLLVTNNKGEFFLKGVKDDAILIITYVGYLTLEIAVKPSMGEIKLVPSNSALDEVLVIAYGTTTRKLNTGSIGKITAKEIAMQPVPNPLMALIGRIPGLEVTQGSGVSGAGLKVQIRGQNSIMQGSDPLFIIDGIPMVAGNGSISTLANATLTNGMSPFNLIDPAEIESIEVLKDADATSIYGSRGANGVIHITTKKGIAGNARLNTNVNMGLSHITRSMDMLNTKQYIAMRKEAFANDGVLPTAATGPDLLYWDQDRYTDFKDLLISGTAQTRNIQVSLKGGTANQNYLLSGSNYHETSVLPSNEFNNRYSLRFNLNQNALKNKLKMTFNAGYSYNKNQMGISDLTYYINTPPNLLLYDNNGKLNWSEGGTIYTGFISNPLAQTNLKYTGQFQNLIAGINVDFKLMRGLEFKSSFGYNSTITDDQTSRPSTSINPFTATLPSANFGNSHRNSLIAEPGLAYQWQFGKSKFNLLLGFSMQNITSKVLNVGAEEYLNDDLLGSIAAAGRIIAENNNSEYKYMGGYARVSYNLNESLLVNASGRRDGTSRFGPGKKFGNFGAIGAAWIFRKETSTGLLNFGKLRTSYGLAGNDQIGDYRYLNTWTATSQLYQGQPGLLPSALLNENFSWETSKKFEVALEVGLLNNNIFFTSAYYANRSGNQLVNYKLPIHTGFPTLLKNLDAVVMNKGFEFTLATKNGPSGLVQWNASFNISMAKNKLVEFENLATSSYNSSYIIGQTLSAKKVYRYIGVDPQKGIYTFEDVNGDGILNTNDRNKIINNLPDFTGGLANSFNVKNIQLDIFLQFKKQQGLNYLFTQASNVPGYYYLNHPVIIEQRWRKPGDIATIQKVTSAANTVAFAAANSHLRNSDAVYSDASFIRVKNVSLSYAVPAKKTEHLNIKVLQIFCQAQNLFTFTNYLGGDPENQNLNMRPPLRTINFGINLTL